MTLLWHISVNCWHYENIIKCGIPVKARPVKKPMLVTCTSAFRNPLFGTKAGEKFWDTVALLQYNLQRNQTHNQPYCLFATTRYFPKISIHPEAVQHWNNWLTGDSVSRPTYWYLRIGFVGFWWLFRWLLLGTDDRGRTDFTVDCRIHRHHRQKGTLSWSRCYLMSTCFRSHHNSWLLQSCITETDSPIFNIIICLLHGCK